MIETWIKKIKDKFSNKAVVLMYHRIAELETDPWQLSVSQQNFKEQLIVLKRNFNVIPVSELVDDIKTKRVRSKSVCLTFDDGYADNFLFAKPLLDYYSCPATFFIPSGYIGKNQRFWWDELEQIILHSLVLPTKISLIIAGELFDFSGIEDILTVDLKKKHKSWIWSEQMPTRRCALYLALWKKLQPLSNDLIIKLIEEIRNWADYKQVCSPKECAMDLSQLKLMMNDPLFELGVHTLTHPALSFHPKDLQEQEISKNRQFIEKLANKKIDYIAFPYGSYNDDTMSIITENKFSAAFTTTPMRVKNDSNPLILGRYQVKNATGEDFNKYLKYLIGN